MYGCRLAKNKKNCLAVLEPSKKHIIRGSEGLSPWRGSNPGSQCSSRGNLKAARAASPSYSSLSRLVRAVARLSRAVVAPGSSCCSPRRAHTHARCQARTGAGPGTARPCAWCGSRAGRRRTRAAARACLAEMMSCRSGEGLTRGQGGG